MTETASKDINGSDTALSVDDTGADDSRDLRQRFIRRWDDKDWMPASSRLPADARANLPFQPSLTL